MHHTGLLPKIDVVGCNRLDDTLELCRGAYYGIFFIESHNEFYSWSFATCTYSPLYCFSKSGVVAQIVLTTNIILLMNEQELVYFIGNKLEFY